MQECRRRSTSRRVQRLVEDEHATVIEVLPEQEFAEEHLPGARNVPLKG
jgi:rhodanese-related sulfurtransferase